MAVETPEKNSEELLSEGWEKRATYNEPRLSELVELYRELDYEVYLKTFNHDEETGCMECMKIFPEQYKTVYTRKKAIT